MFSMTSAKTLWDVGFAGFAWSASFAGVACDSGDFFPNRP
jgi:hypothetical protein